MDTNADEIQRATQILGYSPERFRRLPAEDAQRVYESALRHFVPQGQPRWWWEHFPTSTGVHFTDGDGWRHLTELVPKPDERVWFIAEDFVGPEYSVWEASVRDIQSVIGDCYGFEFYVIQQQFRWLVCENHHDVVVAVGAEVEDSYESMHVRRLPIQLLPDASRVITRYFGPGEENRIRDVVGRLLAVPETEVAALVANLESDFRPIHPNIDDVFLDHYEVVKHHISIDRPISDGRRRFIGACFTMEYAIESAALFNPSMVPAIDQANVPPGSVRFVMSLRATGEGHISSIVFRRGLIDANGNVSVDPPGRYSRPLRATVPVDFAKADFIRQLQSLHAWTEHTQATLALLGDRFTRAELSEAIDKIRSLAAVSGVSEESNDALLALSQANYRLALPGGADVTEAVIFPYSDNERRGIEDLRLVRFASDDGSFHYYGTYTAYSGFQIFPHLLEYPVGQDVEIHMLTGRCAKNKGMALFPRKIRGRYAMVARLDNENLYYMESDHVCVWNEARLLLAPKYPWEVIQIGNCGAPLETEAGWLLLTHGVGPMRQYCIGASLLDLDNPCRVIGQTSQPLLVPTGTERFGYVPNVVYSCGGMIHQGMLVLPYAASDLATSIAVIDLEELLGALVAPPSGR